MSEQVLAFLILSAEVAAVLVLIFAVMTGLFFIRRSRDKRITGQMIQQYKQAAPQNRTRLTQLLQENLALDDADADDRARELLQREKSLYTRLIKIFTGKQRQLFTDLHQDIQALTAAYQQLSSEQAQVTSPRSTATPAPQASTDLEQEIARLKEENQRLNDDLRESIEAMDQLMQEYTALYARFESGGGKPKMAAKLDALKQRMEPQESEA